MLKQRVITALILVAVLLALLFYTSAAQFAVVVGLIVMVGAWEWANLAGFTRQSQRIAYAASIGLLILACAFYCDFVDSASLALLRVRDVLSVACVWWALALLWVQSYPSSALLWGSQWLRALIGILVLVPTWLALLMLREEPAGAWLIVLMMAIVAAADIGAYFTGKAFGRRKLAPAVSPGKTWEGFAGGLCCALLVALGAGWLSGQPLLLTALVVPTVLASVLGDLLESMLKRHRGIKDSSQLLPGHGGVLDRIDSMTAAAPVFALAVLVSGWQLPG